MDRQPKSRITGDIEGTGVIGNPAHAFFARHVEAGYQRMPRSRRIFGRCDHSLGAEMPLARDDDAGFDAGLFLGDADTLGNTGEIGVRAKPDAVAMIGRDDQLAVDRIGLGQFRQIGFRQDRIVLIGLEYLRHRIVALDEFRKIRPDILAVAQKAAGVDAVFLRLFHNEGGGAAPSRWQ